MLTGYVREKMERFIPKPLHAYKFALMWFGRTLSTLGDNCYDIALVWLAINLTGSTILLGTVLTASYIPAILLLFLGGVWADYMGPTNILLWSDILRALATLLLALLTTLGYISIPALFLFALFYGLIAAFFDPSMGVLFASIVEPDDYNAAMSFQYMSLELAALLGPALGGWLIARYSISAAFVFDALTFVFSALAIALIRRRIRRETGGIRVSEPTEHFRFKEVFAGFHFLWREKGILAAFILFALTNGLNNTVAVLVPVLARFTLKLSAAQFGLLASCSAVGTLTAAFLLNIIGSRIRHRVFVVCGSLIAFGGTIAFMGFTQEWWQLCIAYFLFGWFFMIGEIVSSTLWLHIIPSDLRGRVFSVLSTLALSLNPVGFLFAGVLGSVYGTRVGLWIGGGAIAFLSAAALLITPVRNLDQLKPMQNESNS